MAVLILRTHYPTSKTVLACGSRRRKRFRPDENCSLWSPLHQYINDQQPHKVINNNCLFRRRPHKPASCDAFVWIQRGHEKRGSKWVQTWHVWPPTFEFWEGVRHIQAQCRHTSHCQEFTETGNRAEKSLDSRLAWSIWPDLCSHS